ncbi:uncharacterized protein APUU_20530S [Aspergillus puulaauensis]|uniref:Uncharacterized protein n=1 Tax=Aspergillus puulaauensis TaxID=1220207 RepID=A0A7R7XF79_9EURO|nr:uncharacterized protein APUU_20530S [Aspergillus puulaauensis]BCS20098.1 hypothetical protein APUU_20530S [Aspergillus puulaauensis]
MATKHLLSPFQDHHNPHKTSQTHKNITGSRDRNPENSHGKTAFEAFDSWGPASVSSDNTLPEEESPYTEQFFSDMAKTIIHSFPFRKFAKQHGCKVEDVFHAVRATVVEPLSKPTCAKAARHAAAVRIAHATKATESTKSKSNAPTSTSNKSPELRRSAKRRKTMAPSERQLVEQDIYGNYIPVEAKKKRGRLFS